MESYSLNQGGDGGSLDRLKVPTGGMSTGPTSSSKPQKVSCDCARLPETEGESSQRFSSGECPVSQSSVWSNGDF